MPIMREVAESLQRLFGSDVEAMAAGTGVIRRRRKFDAISLLRTIVLTVLKHPQPRPADFRRTARQFGVGISKAAMTDRFNDRLVAFLRVVLTRSLGRVLAARPADLALLQGFTHVFIGDATTVPLPDDYAAEFPGCGGTAGTGRAAMKIQLLWEVLTGAVHRLVIEAGKSSDATSPIAHEALPAGSLALFDLGYFCLRRFGRMTRAGVSWVSRLQIGVNVYEATGRELRLLDVLQARWEAGQRPIDITVLLGVKDRLRCRLIAVRVPQEVAARRRQEAREKAAKHGRAASRDYLRWQDWTILVTDCDAGRLSWRAAVVLYRTRWQIELMFKLWKSHNGLAAHRAEAPPREQLATVYAKLIAALAQHWILVAATWSSCDRSLMKAAVTLREWITTLAEALDHVDRLIGVLQRLEELFAGDRVESRRKRPSQFQLLQEPRLLEWEI